MLLTNDSSREKPRWSMKPRRFFRDYWRRIAIVTYDSLAIVVSYAAAYVTRAGWPMEEPHVSIFLNTLLPLFICRQIVFIGLRLHRSPWRYASIPDMINIVRAVALSSGLFLVLMAFYNRWQSYPRSVPLLDAVFLIVLLGGARIGFRAWREGQILSPKIDYGKDKPKRALIVGAGDCGEQVVRELDRARDGSFEPIGFVDDARSKRHSMIRNLPVMGDTRDIPKLVKEYGITEIIIAIPSAPYAKLREIYEISRKTGAEVVTVPNLAGIAEGRVDVRSLRRVQVEDLLGREAVELDLRLSEQYLRGRRILVTGAGGSIGTEICRQVLSFGPAQIILFGHGENSIFQTTNDLAERGWTGRVRPVVGCFTRREKVMRVFEEYRPEIVFHAGAHKHVHLMEMEPDEAVWNNVIGTRNVLDAASEWGAQRVVCISTDKAADPVSVMGCSKRIAEMLVHGSQSPPITVGVRFGNVLGSRGSVVPLFRRQIERGGPLTVTHPDMTRFFMTIPEAVQLVIQAGAIGKGGEIFMLDMGEPISIVQLARDMIELSGLRPGVDIEIRFVGIRPGERLVERLVGIHEILQPTDQPKIFRLEFEPEAEPVDVRTVIDDLERASFRGDRSRVLQLMKEIVPEFEPGSFVDSIRTAD